jgi:hypothetical protein
VRYQLSYQPLTIKELFISLLKNVKNEQFYQNNKELICKIKHNWLRLSSMTAQVDWLLIEISPGFCNTTMQ